MPRHADSPEIPLARARPSGPRRVTMGDIAEAAGCSQATVSFVLNDAPGIRVAAETRARVLDAARRLGYAAAPVAGPGAATAKPPETRRRIGVLVDQLATSPDAQRIVAALAQAARAAGALVLTVETGGDAALEAEAARAFADGRVAALAYVTGLTREVALPPALTALGLPLYLLNGTTADQTVPSVVPSEVAGAQRATRHLIERGHTRIAAITGEMWTETAQERLKGYRRALASADIPFAADRVIEGDGSAAAGSDATRRLLGLPRPPTAILCLTEPAAAGCLAALRAAGQRIPGDVSVIGYDDDEPSRRLGPRMTAVVPPFRAMGQWLVNQLDAPPPPQPRPPVTKLECPLIDGETVAAPRR